MIGSLHGSAALPIGSILPYAGPVDQDDRGTRNVRIEAELASIGWLVCDGRLLDRRDDAALFAVLGTAYDVGSVPPDKFMIPDLRGRFLRGLNGAAEASAGELRDPGWSDRQGGGVDRVGSLQEDCFQGHEHDYESCAQADGGDIAEAAATMAGVQATTSVASDGSNGTPRVGKETRPKNLGLNFLIRRV